MIPTADEQLRASGVRVTAPRVAVLTALAANPGHHEVRAVSQLVHDAGRPLSKQAAYDVLTALTAAGLVRRIQPSGSAARFEVRTGDNHHHLVCRACGAVVDVDCANEAAPCLSVTDARGFTVDEAEITFWGLCPACTPPERSDARA